MKTRVKRITNSRLFLEQIGWYSTGLFLCSYILVSTGVMTADSLVYQMLNLSGAAGYSFYAHKRKVYPSLFANLVWAGVGVYAIVTIIF